MYVSAYTPPEPIDQESHRVADSPVMYYREIIPAKIVDVMVDELKEMEEFRVDFEDAGVGGDRDDRNDHAVRNSKVHWWPEHHWVCSIMSHYIGLANKHYWEYDCSFMESIQVSVYEAGGHYAWHSDYGTSSDTNFTRKLSASLLVSEPSEYIGGDLEFIDYHGNLVKAPKEKGSIIVFPSFVWHRVKPVTSGTRYSLVVWHLGKPFK